MTDASGVVGGGRSFRPPPVLVAGVLAATVALSAAAAIARVPGWVSHPPARTSAVHRSLNGRNARDDAIKNDYLYDSGYETCGALGLRLLSQRLDVPPRPALVAAAFARRFDPSVRAGPRAGCLEALREPVTVAGSAWTHD